MRIYKAIWLSITVITLVFLLLVRGMKRELLIHFSYLTLTILTGLIVLAQLFWKSHQKNTMPKNIIKLGWLSQNLVKILFPWLLEHLEVIEKQSTMDPMHIYMLSSCIDASLLLVLAFAQGLSKQEVIRLVVPVFVLSEGTSFALKVHLSDHSSTWNLVSELSALIFFAASICLSTHYVNSLQDEIMAKVRL